MQPDKMPQALKDHKSWCVWKKEKTDKGKYTKIPYNPHTGGKAQSNNKDTFAPFDVALKAYQGGGYSGLGI